MDEITDAILTNPELLEQVQGKDIRIVDTHESQKHGQMVTLADEKNFYVISAELLKSDERFCDSPVVKAYLETLYH